MNINFTEEKQIIIELLDIMTIKIVYCKYTKMFTILYIRSNLDLDWIIDSIYDKESLVYSRLHFMLVSKREEIKCSHYQYG